MDNNPVNLNDVMGDQGKPVGDEPGGDLVDDPNTPTINEKTGKQLGKDATTGKYIWTDMIEEVKINVTKTNTDDVGPYNDRPKIESQPAKEYEYKIDLEQLKEEQMDLNWGQYMNGNGGEAHGQVYFWSIVTPRLDNEKNKFTTGVSVEIRDGQGTPMTKIAYAYLLDKDGNIIAEKKVEKPKMKEGQSYIAPVGFMGEVSFELDSSPKVNTSYTVIVEITLIVHTDNGNIRVAFPTSLGIFSNEAINEILINTTEKEDVDENDET